MNQILEASLHSCFGETVSSIKWLIIRSSGSRQPETRETDNQLTK